MKKWNRILGVIGLTIVLIATPYMSMSEVQVLPKTIAVADSDWMLIPHDIAKTKEGTFLVTGNYDSRIVEIDSSGKILKTYNTPEIDGFQNGCVAALKDGRRFAMTSKGIFELTSLGSVKELLNMKDKTALQKSGIDGLVTHMTSDGFNTLYVAADSGKNGSQFYSFDTKKKTVKVLASYTDRSFRGLCFGKDQKLYAYGCESGKIISIDLKGKVSVFKEGLGKLMGPIYLEFVPSGNILTGDWTGMYEITPQGEILKRPELTCRGGDFVVNEDGSYYGLDPYAANFFKVSSKGEVTLIKEGKIIRNAIALPDGSYTDGKRAVYPDGSSKDWKSTLPPSTVYAKNGTAFYGDKFSVMQQSPNGSTAKLVFVGMSPVNLAYNEHTNVLYVLGMLNGNYLLKKIQNGVVSDVYDTGNAYYQCSISLDAIGNLYLSLQHKRDFHYSTLLFALDGQTKEVLNIGGHEGGITCTAGSKTGEGAYVLLSPFQFTPYFVKPNGNWTVVPTSGKVKAADYHWLFTTATDQLVFSSPGFVYRTDSPNLKTEQLTLKQAAETRTVSSGTLQQVKLEVDGMSSDLAIDCAIPSALVYNKSIQGTTLTFDLWVPSGTVAGQYNLSLRQAPSKPLVIESFWTIKP